MQSIEILDSTLREGAQGEGISFSVADKNSIARVLDRLGIRYIEAGNPASNPKDAEFFAQTPQLKTAEICAFGSTCAKNTDPQQDAGLAALIASGAGTVCIFGKASAAQVASVLKTTQAENLLMISRSIEYLTDRGRHVIFEAEHFFDGYAQNKNYALACLKAARKADVLCLCDSTGGALPAEVARVVADIKALFPEQKIGVHLHNDCDMAVASALAAVQAGAQHIQGSLTGLGERCGLCNLASVIANLQGRLDIPCITGELAYLTEAAHTVCEIANMRLRRDMPFVGKSAFAHNAGMHVDASFKQAGAYEVIDPHSVGNQRRFLMSEISGKNAVYQKLKDHFDVRKDSPQIAKVTRELKRLEWQGYQFEGADASFELMARRVLLTYQPHFELILYKTTGEFFLNGEEHTSAMVEVRVGGRNEVTAALGNGPVNALDAALRRALIVFYPQIARTRLTDFKVRVLTPRDATGAVVRVLVETTDGEATWSTVGVSTDIIRASFLALNDAMEYYLKDTPAAAQEKEG